MTPLLLLALATLACALNEGIPPHIVANIREGNDIHFKPIDEFESLDPETFRRDYASQGRPGLVSTIFCLR